MDTTWQARAAQWRRFAEWEARRLREAPIELGETLTWMGEAFDLARRSDPSWSAGLDLDHVREIGRVRAALAHMRLPA